MKATESEKTLVRREIMADHGERRRYLYTNNKKKLDHYYYEGLSEAELACTFARC